MTCRGKSAFLAPLFWPERYVSPPCLPVPSPVRKWCFRTRRRKAGVVGFDDGSFSLLAQVTDGGRSFSMWADAAEMVQLQFYDETWQLGQGETANLAVQIDRRAPWSLTAAELHEQSVFFDIPDSDAGIRFMDEVLAGNVLYLSNESGESVESYSLAGSRASVGALIECVSALKSDSNPFQ